MSYAVLEEYGLELVYLQSVIAGVLVPSTDEGINSQLSVLLDRVSRLLLDVKRRLTVQRKIEASEACACRRVYGNNAPYTLPHVFHFQRTKPTV
ncbi:hypothetical protein ZOSMA_111G00180 [Zostera marina]|uniref:Uncharacterized protein n=1 Tax=Zostera marina TaxID=29655 RepID=A0A0K9Q583_ZOSMR|nr:hypothetical protein ZOSMA_111G00180 [Zostera marina]